MVILISFYYNYIFTIDF